MEHHWESVTNTVVRDSVQVGRHHIECRQAAVSTGVVRGERATDRSSSVHVSHCCTNERGPPRISKRELPQMCAYFRPQLSLQQNAIMPYWKDPVPASFQVLPTRLCGLYHFGFPRGTMKIATDHTPAGWLGSSVQCTTTAALCDAYPHSQCGCRRL